MGKRSNGTRMQSASQSMIAASRKSVMMRVVSGGGKISKKAVDSIIETNYKSNEYFTLVGTKPFRNPAWYNKAVKNKDIEVISRSERKLDSEKHYIGDGRGHYITSFSLDKKETSTLTRYGDKYVLRQNVYTNRAGVWSMTGSKNTIWKVKKKAFKE